MLAQKCTQLEDTAMHTEIIQMIGGFQMQQKQMRPDCGAFTRCIPGESEIHELWCNGEALLNWVEVLFLCCAEVFLELCRLECWL